MGVNTNINTNQHTHRGGFGEFGGDAGHGLIERAFRERIVLVALLREADTSAAEASLDELNLLVDTAGADAVARLSQKRRAPDPATFVGAGKVSEIREVAEEVDCDTVVFDDDLSPAQQFNLEKLLGRTVIDRTAVILDIFAQNACTPEGQAQVELAQLRYRLPRLRGSGSRLSQQAGGIGTRGPGETRLETDRRRLEQRIHRLEARLRNIESYRRSQSKSRRRTRNRAVALVGYTNAGKSMLFNRLTAADVSVEDRLFATLDPSTRRLVAKGGETLLLTDTVGFIRKLPHHLVKAFKTTLDVVCEADLLVHVVDVTSADIESAITSVRSVLKEIEADDIPELVVFNKIDKIKNSTLNTETSMGGSNMGGSNTNTETSLSSNNMIDVNMGDTNLPTAKAKLERLRVEESAVSVSALTGEGLGTLAETIAEQTRVQSRTTRLFIPWSDSHMIATVHREGQILRREATEKGMRMVARLDDSSAGLLKSYIA